jgi:hypothetical protein
VCDLSLLMCVFKSDASMLTTSFKSPCDCERLVRFEDLFLEKRILHFFTENTCSELLLNDKVDMSVTKISSTLVVDKIEDRIGQLDGSVALPFRNNQVFQVELRELPVSPDSFYSY